MSLNFFCLLPERHRREHPRRRHEVHLRPLPSRRRCRTRRELARLRQNPLEHVLAQSLNLLQAKNFISNKEKLIN